MITAASIGIVHTVLGPNHYLPFVIMARSRNWSHAKTCLITACCGFGHVLGSMILGLIGVVSGLAVSKIHLFDSIRATAAAWLLIGFGLVYCVYGLRRAFRRKTCTPKTTGDPSPWILFSIFLLCPCEPLIPLLLYPAATAGLGSAAIISLVFGLTSTLTMLSIVLLTTMGLSKINISALAPYGHSIAGVAVTICGLLILLHH